MVQTTSCYLPTPIMTVVVLTTRLYVRFLWVTLYFKNIRWWNNLSTPYFKRENREIPVAQLLTTYDRAVVHFKIVYKTSFGRITIHFYRRLRKNNFNYAVAQDYNTSILSSLETRPYYKTVLAQRRHNQSLLSATTTYSIVNWCGIRHFPHV